MRNNKYNKALNTTSAPDVESDVSYTQRAEEWLRGNISRVSNKIRPYVYLATGGLVAGAALAEGCAPHDNSVDYERIGHVQQAQWQNGATQPTWGQTWGNRSPSVHWKDANNGVAFFSSNQSLTGNPDDIYYSTTADGGNTWIPEALAKDSGSVIKVNSAWNEQGVAVCVGGSCGGGKLFFTTERDGGDDVYWGDLNLTNYEITNVAKLPSGGANVNDDFGVEQYIAVNPASTKLYFVSSSTTYEADIGVWTKTALSGITTTGNEGISVWEDTGQLYLGVGATAGCSNVSGSIDNCRYDLNESGSPVVASNLMNFNAIPGSVAVNDGDIQGTPMVDSKGILWYISGLSNQTKILRKDPVPGAVCGDGNIEGAEQCDDGPANGTPCTPAYGLSCNWCDNSCVTQTVPIQEWCDDTITNGPEQCDNGPVQNGQACTPPYGNSCNYCDDGCLTVNVPMAEYCDDNVVNGPEQCDDGPVLNGQLCTPPYGNSCTYCTQTCTNDSVPMAEFCGDNTKNGPEVCDGSDLDSQNCATQGFQAGPGLACANDCLSFNTSACTPLPSCGDTFCNGAETCSSCPGDCGACCGNGALDNGEQCDDGVNNTNVACTPVYNDTCTYCDTGCVEHTEQGATCGDGNCDNGFEDENNCANDCGSGGGGAGGMGAGGAGGGTLGCKMEVVEGPCEVSCDEAGDVTATFGPDETCKIQHVTENCYIKATRPAIQPQAVVTVDTGGHIYIPGGYDNLDIENAGHCFGSSHIAGISGGFMGTRMQKYYDPSLKEDGVIPTVTTYTIVNGQMNFNAEIDGQPIDVTPDSDPFPNCMNDQICTNNEVPGGESFTIDEENPHGKTDTVTPPTPEDNGGCSACSTPGAVSSDTRENLTFLLGLVFAAAARRRRRRL